MENIEHNNINPDRPHWNWWIAFFVWVMSVLFILIMQSIAVGGYMAINQLQFSQPEEMQNYLTTNPNAILWTIGSVIFAHIFTVALAWFIITKNGTQSFTETLGWKWNGFHWWHCLIAVGIFYMIAAGLTTIFGEQENEFKRMLAISRSIVFLVAFMATFTAPLVEEVVYRGVLYSAALKEFGKTQAIIATTAYFAIVHVPQYFPDVAVIIAICLLSLGLTLIRAKTGSLLPCIALHTIFNASQSALLIAEPYLKTWITSIESQPALLLRFWLTI